MAWLSSSQNARSSWPGAMPRSRQISAMTAPTGRRRTSAAISSSVGRHARRGTSLWSAGWGSGWASGGAICRAARGPLAAGSRTDAGVRSRPRAARWRSLGFEGRGSAQAIGDAGEDDREVGGAEGSGEHGETWGGSALLDRAGELLAVVDQFADEAEDSAEGGGQGRVPRGGSGSLVGAGAWAATEMNVNKSMEAALSRKYFLRRQLAGAAAWARHLGTLGPRQPSAQEAPHIPAESRAAWQTA